MLNVHQLQISLGNINRGDETFLRDLVAIFTDPVNAELLSALRSGSVALVYSPKDGHAHYLPVTHETDKPMSSDLMNFVARFDEVEWETLVCSAGKMILQTAREDIAMAEAHARNILGYLPEKRTMEIANG